MNRKTLFFYHIHLCIEYFFLLQNKVNSFISLYPETFLFKTQICHTFYQNSSCIQKGLLLAIGKQQTFKRIDNNKYLLSQKIFVCLSIPK